MEPGVLVAAIVVPSICWTLVQVVHSIFGRKSATEGESLKQSEVEAMIRQAVREEVRPLHEKIDRLEQQGGLKDTPRRRPLPEDPHDFGLIADGGERSTAPHAA